MQALTAPPRDALTDDQVRDLLLGDVVTVSVGAELLTQDLAVVEDISDDLQGGTVSRDMYADIHGDFRLQLSRQLDWATDLLQVYMTLANTSGLSARFDVGVAALITPALPAGETPVTYDVQGYDRLYLLRRPVGDTYFVPAGEDVLTAVADAFAAAGLTGIHLDGTAAGKTLASDMVWPLIPTGSDGANDTGSSNWLDIINQLLATVGYRGLWVDEHGFYRSEPYQNPRDRSPEFAFDVDDLTTTIVAAARTLTTDDWNRPNKWIFIQQNRDTAPTDGDGLYTVDHSGDGLAWVKQVTVDAADQFSLQAQGDQTVADDEHASSSLSLTTAPFPLAGHFDVYSYTDLALPDVSKVQAVSWSLPLDGSDMSWTWEAVA